MTDLNHRLFENVDAQDQSPFFQLPGEVRDRIYSYALSAYEDNTQPYDRNTYWYRPQYAAERKTDTALLQSCKRTYAESWYMPFSSKDHSFWLTTRDRAPAGAKNASTLNQALSLLHSAHRDVEIEHVRFFAQLWSLEPGPDLSEYLDLAHFHPRCITITLRHTDWWYWETDRELAIKAGWVRDCRFPNSLRYFRMELESLERKKVQIDSMVQQMKQKWYLTRKDDTKLFATNTLVEISRWKGSSKWSGERWVRDETDAEPEIVNYYVATITWQYEPEGAVDITIPPPNLKNMAKQAKFSRGQDKLSRSQMHAAQIPDGTPASAAITMFTEYQNARRTGPQNRGLFAWIAARQASEQIQQQTAGTTPAQPLPPSVDPEDEGRSG